MLLDALVVVVILTLAFLGMWFGWRARGRRQTDVPALPTPPADLGTIRRRDDVLYVATTRADAPLDRIAVNGLGFRARAQVTVAESGVRLDIAGESPVFVPTPDLVGVGRATWTIDRVVSNSGLVFLRFRLGAAGGDRAVLVDAYLRPEDPAGLVDAITGLLPADKKEAA